MRFLPIFKKREPDKRRILLVDDESGFTRLVKVMLEQSGRYTVREENDAAKALEVALELKPDLVLLDLVMPKIDGASLGRQIQNDPQLQGTRIVLLTGSISKNHHKPTRVGDFLALSKPVGIQELMQAIDANLSAP